jgi:hypothetical protein
MRLEFVAADADFFTPDIPEIYCLIAQIGGTDADGDVHYVLFQRSTEDEPLEEDGGVDFSFDDQINSGYNCIRVCRLSRPLIQISLIRPIDWEKKVTEIVVDITKLNDASFIAFRNGLTRIFRDTEGILEII